MKIFYSRVIFLPVQHEQSHINYRSSS